MELNQIYNQINQTWTPLDVKVQGDAKAKNGNWWTDPTKANPNANPPITNNLTLAHTKIKEFVCPSHDPYSSTPYIGIGAHFFCLGPPSLTTNGIFVQQDTSKTDKLDFQDIGRTTYLGVAGTYGKGSYMFPTSNPAIGDIGRYEGIFTNRSTNSVGAIQDGTSNTLMFGECLGGPTPPPSGSPSFGFSWFAMGALPTIAGLPVQYPYYYQFSSKHTGVVNFCYADGSVRGLKVASSKWNPLDPEKEKPPPTADWFVLQQLSGIRDGESRDSTTMEQ
jgi:prepilin-type processing-associated H-X9-DG protein